MIDGDSSKANPRGAEENGGRDRRGSRDRRRAPHTREAILDAAEAIFVESGYHGASIRSISDAAGVQKALAYYHFGSKEDLFRAVVERRADDNTEALREALDAALQVGGTQRARVEALLSAFLRPIVEHATQRGDGWRNYIRLLAQVGSLPQQESFVVPVNERYDAVVRDYIAALAQLFPKIDPVDVHWGFYFLQAAIANALIETGMVDRQSDGRCRSSDLDTIVEKMTRFFAAGFRGYES